MKNKMYKVSVEREVYLTGTVLIRASDEEAACAHVDMLITSGALTVNDVTWGDVTYSESMFTTGDVE